MSRLIMVLALAGVSGMAVLLTLSQSRAAALKNANAELTYSLASAKASLAQAAEAARVHRIYLDQQEADAKAWAALARDLQSLEGQNAPLSPLLGTTAERLFAAP